MLMSLIYMFVYAGIMSIIESSFVDKLKEVRTVSSAVKIRQKVKFLRISIFILSMPFILLSQMWLNSGAGLPSYQYVQMLGIPISFYIVLLRRRKYNSPFSPFSSLTYDDVAYSNQEFILFLRGFESDDYTAEEKLKRRKHFKGFSEYHFINEVKKKTKMSTYAVGMTKELSAPLGADRVYLEDCYWKSNVKQLMEKAKYVIVEINDRDSCIWEIGVSDDLFSKTIYLITDLEKYLNVYSYFSNKHCLLRHRMPHPSVTGQYLCFWGNGGNVVYYKFENTKESYKVLVEYLYKTKFSQKQ